MLSLEKYDGSVPTTPDETLKLRFDYAWKWFSYHAAQRTSMFNYFLIAAGIGINAYVSAVTNGPPVLATVIGVLGFLISVAFMMLDLRNRALIKMGEEVLQILERHQIFTENLRGRNETKQRSFQVALLFREAAEDNVARKTAQQSYICEGLYMFFRNVTHGKHWFWLGCWIQGCIVVCFLLAGIYASRIHTLVLESKKSAAVPTSNQQGEPNSGKAAPRSQSLTTYTAPTRAESEKSGAADQETKENKTQKPPKTIQNK